MSSTHELTDEQLIARYKESENSLWVGYLFQRYSHLVYIICLKYLKNTEESKDASMQIFEKLCTDLKKHDVHHFRSWLYKVAKNYCLMQIRQHKQFVDVEEINELSLVTMEYDAHLHLEEKELNLSFLEEALALLKEEQKKCIELFFLQERSYKEIIELTGYSFKEVKTHIQNGRRNLQNYLKEKHEKKDR